MPKKSLINAFGVKIKSKKLVLLKSILNRIVQEDFETDLRNHTVLNFITMLAKSKFSTIFGFQK